ASPKRRDKTICGDGLDTNACATLLGRESATLIFIDCNQDGRSGKFQRLARRSLGLLPQTSQISGWRLSGPPEWGRFSLNTEVIRGISGNAQILPGATGGDHMAIDPAHESGRILIGKSDTYQYLTLALGNRHGLVAGATGTGKTVTLQVLAEGFSSAGTAVFTADVKGDLAGISMPGNSQPHFVKRAKDIGIAYTADEFPVTFWDLFGQSATLSAPESRTWVRSSSHDSLN